MAFLSDSVNCCSIPPAQNLMASNNNQSIDLQCGLWLARQLCWFLLGLFVRLWPRGGLPGAEWSKMASFRSGWCKPWLVSIRGLSWSAVSAPCGLCLLEQTWLPHVAVSGQCSKMGRAEATCPLEAWDDHTLSSKQSTRSAQCNRMGNRLQLLMKKQPTYTIKGHAHRNGRN